MAGARTGATRVVNRRHLLAVLFTITALTAAGCRSVVPPDPARFRTVSPQLGQLLLVGFRGTEADADADLERLICQVRVGGILLFGRNVVDGAQVARLTARARELARACDAPRLLVAVDAEGGQVMRLGPTAGYTPTLSAAELGASNDLTLAELEGLRIGQMLQGAGINWNLAPVVDVGYNPANPVIVGYARSFGADPRQVVTLAGAWIRGMHAAGVLTALKHFPGHGSSFADSHHGFVDVTETADLSVELVPYRELMAANLADSVMTAHVFNGRLDRRYPATLSAPTITGLLRQQLAFEGVVVSDDLRMGAIEQRYGIDRAAVLTVKAGVDVVLVADDRLPDGRSAAAVALVALRQAVGTGRLPLDRVTEALVRVRALKARVKEDGSALEENYRPMKAMTSSLRGSDGWAPRRVQARAAAALAKRSPSMKGVRSARATASAALKVSPAAVVSTAATSKPGTWKASPSARPSAPSAPRVTTTAPTPCSRSTRAACVAEAGSSPGTPLSRAASPAFGVR
jgi:beta-N-acetylhexosaminidase